MAYQDGVPLASRLRRKSIIHWPSNRKRARMMKNQLGTFSLGPVEFQFVPTVDRYRWLEAAPPGQHPGPLAARQNDDLQFAFFTARLGKWENVWGIWNGITPRDAEATRRVATIERAVAPFLV